MEDESAKQPIYLHDNLDLKIIEARPLPNMDAVSTHLRRCVTLCGACTTPSPGALDGTNQKIHTHRQIITSESYVTVSVPQATVSHPRVIKNPGNPHWDEHFSVPLVHPVVNIEFQVKDDDVLGSELIEAVKIPAQKVATREVISGWFPLIGVNGKPPKPDSTLRIEMKFTPCQENQLYRHGVGSDPLQAGVRNTYFLLRKGSMVKLYQDAHVPHGMLPKIEFERREVYKQDKCWEDICFAISEAHHLIHIVGWSVFLNIELVREPTRPLPRGGDLTLGELFKYKSAEGVRVLMLIWDDKTSHDKFGIKTVRNEAIVPLSSCASCLLFS